MQSNRAEVLAQLPRSGAPPAFASYEEWEAFVDYFARLGIGADYTRFWWDIRPHPNFGTLEIRMPDQPTSLAVTAVITAILQELCRAALDRPRPEHDPAGRGFTSRTAGPRASVERGALPSEGERTARAWSWPPSSRATGSTPRAPKPIANSRSGGRTASRLSARTSSSAR